LVRQGYLRQAAEKFNVLQLTDQGAAALRERQSIRLTKAAAVTKVAKARAGEISCDETLFERLRRLRKRLADERGVPPYIVFSDVSLRQMARYYPSNESEFAQISGVGEQKLKRFGKKFISEIAAYLRARPTQSRK
jgi:ATP-dependent DNA helicase RecQ